MDDKELLGDIERKNSEVVSVRSENRKILQCCDKLIIAIIMIVDIAFGVLFIIYHKNKELAENYKNLCHWSFLVSVNYIWLYSILFILLILNLCKRKIKINYFKNIHNFVLFFFHLIALGRFILIVVITVIMAMIERKKFGLYKILLVIWLVFNYLSFLMICKFFTIDFVKNLIKCCKKAKKKEIENGRSRNKSFKEQNEENQETSVIYT